MVRELVAAHAYTVLGFGSFYVPKHRLAVMPLLNEFTAAHPVAVAMVQELNRGREQQDQVAESVHLLSRRVAAYQVRARLRVCVSRLPTSQPVSQPVSPSSLSPQSVSQPVNQLVSQSASQPVSPSVRQVVRPSLSHLVRQSASLSVSVTQSLRQSSLRLRHSVSVSQPVSQSVSQSVSSSVSQYHW